MCAERKSRYIIEEGPNSFTVCGRPEPVDVPGAPKWLADLAYEWNGTRRTAIQVVQHPFCLEIIPEGGEPQRTDFCDFRQVLTQIVDTLMSSWEPPERKVKHPWRGAKHWVYRRTRWALCARVHAQWQRLLARVDPTVLDVHKKVFAAGFGYDRGELHMSPELYRNKYLVKDILNFRAAAMAVTICGREELPEALEEARNWPNLFVPDGYPVYTSLRKTLTRLPGGLGPQLVYGLRRVVLPRPYCNRLELLSVLSTATAPARHFRVLAFAQEDKIKAAASLVFEEAGFLEWWEYRRWWRKQPSLRRSRDVRDAIEYIGDYPEEHKGDITGLARKAIRWHRQADQRKITNTLGAERQCALPPIELPADSRIRFLACVNDVVEEGERMHHCIGKYVQRAVNGQAYLFHVDRGGSSASVEVDRWGRVQQSVGPQNSINDAADWGKTQLAEWGARFPTPEALASIG